MSTSNAIPICRSPFQGESLISSSSSSPKSVGAGSSSPRPKSSYGTVTMAYYANENKPIRDAHTTLGVAPGASRDEIKKAYRHLALQYHPDVCNGNHCTTNFQQLNSAYEMLLNKATPEVVESEDDFSNNLEGFAGAGNDSWEDWEEWMGWEGAGTLDYSDHINYAL